MPSSNCAVPVFPATLTCSPFIARRAVPSTTTDRIAPAINAAEIGRENLLRRVPSSSCCHRSPSAPPASRRCAAMVAATRAILNGVTSTGPCPYAANGNAAWISATLPAGISSSLAVSLNCLRAHREHSELREIRIARNRDGLLHGERSVRRIADVVANRFAPSGNDRAHAAVRQPAATEALVFERRDPGAARPSPSPA